METSNNEIPLLGISADHHSFLKDIHGLFISKSKLPSQSTVELPKLIGKRYVLGYSWSSLTFFLNSNIFNEMKIDQPSIEDFHVGKSPMVKIVIIIPDDINKGNTNSISKNATPNIKGAGESGTILGKLKSEDVRRKLDFSNRRLSQEENYPGNNYPFDDNDDDDDEDDDNDTPIYKKPRYSRGMGRNRAGIYSNNHYYNDNNENEESSYKNILNKINQKKRSFGQFNANRNSNNFNKDRNIH